MAPTVTALVNQKGGVAKSTSCINLGAALVQEGKRVLLVDTDPQASMTIALGNQQPDNLPITMADLMAKVMNDQQLTPGEGVLHHSEGMDLLPSSIALAGTEVSLVNAMSRESTLKYLLNDYRKDYDHILIDCIGDDADMKTFNRIVRKYGVDYAVRKVEKDGAKQYLIFFKARDKDTIYAAMSEYANHWREHGKEEKPSVRKLIAFFRKGAEMDKDRAVHKEISR